MTGKDNYIFELSDQVTRKPVAYKNRYGITISADLYLAKELDLEKQHPAVLIGPPYGGVKEQGPGIYDWTIARLLGHSSLVNVKYYRKMSNQTLADETRQARHQMSLKILECLDGWEEEYEQIRQDAGGQ